MNILPDHIISRVLNGDASSDDIFLLSAWLNESEKNREEFRMLKNYWDAEVSLNHPVLPELSAEKLLSEINSQKKNPERKRFRPMQAVAAVIIILFLTTGTFIVRQYQKNNIQKAFTYLTNNNKSNFALNDGTKVILNKNSSLTYSDTYGKEFRTVKLAGEAFFEVTKDSVVPFIVQLEGATIQVLGTSFTIQADPKSEIISATLVNGSIRFKSPKQQVMLSPNQKLIYNRTSNEIEILPVDASEEIAWKDGILKYKSVSFTRLIADLEKNYQVNIIINNKKLTDPTISLSGAFSENQPIEEVLKVVSRSLPFKWEKKGDTYYILE